jgi:hypothetical protein
MRDQDMIDVDVTTPGVWERESDVQFDELMRRELEDEANGVVPDDTSRPRARGGLLTEQNLKVWLSVVRFYLRIPGWCLSLFRTRGSPPQDSRP